jgi:hypothetical protein
MTTLVAATIADIVLLVAGLAFYLYWVGTLLTRIAANLEECRQIVGTIVGHAELIGPGVEHINRAGGIVAGALPLLYGMAEGIVTGVTPAAEPPAARAPARPASGQRRSRLLDAVGFVPHR